MLSVALALQCMAFTLAALARADDCARERLKMAAEADVRAGRGTTWYEHIQKAGGHAVCELYNLFGEARPCVSVRRCGPLHNGRCGDSRADEALNALRNATAARSFLRDRGASFYGHEFGALPHAPEPGIMAYVAVVREPRAWSASWRRRFRSRDATSFAEQLGAWRVPGAHAPEALLAAAKQFVDACSVAFALDDPADDDGGFAVLGWGRRDPAALRFAMARNANRTRASNARLVADDSGDSASDLDAEIYEYARSHGTRQRERRIACGLGS